MTHFIDGVEWEKDTKIQQKVTWPFHLVIQGIPAFHDFGIRDPRCFVIHFQASFGEFPTIS